MSDAIDSWTQAFSEDPDNERAFAALEEQHFLDASWDALVKLYRARLGAPSIQADADLGAALHFRLAQILEERVEDTRAATEAYWAVAQLQPNHHRALRQLRRIHARQMEWEIVLEIADLEAQTPMPDHERASSLAEFGELWRVQLDDIDKSVECFDKALALDPDQIDALTGLARARASQEDYAAAAELWEKVVDRQRGPDRAAALLEAARLFTGELDEPDHAAECYRRALTDDPRSAEAVEGLVAHAEANEQWTLLSDLLERRFDLAAGARRRTEIAVGASELHIVHLDNPSHARLWLDRARELSPDEPRVYEAAAKIERRAGNQGAVLIALEESIRLVESPPLELLLEAATLCRAADDDERALEHLRSALLEAPEDPVVAEQLDICLARLCRDEERIDVIERRIALAPTDDTKCNLLCELARVHRDVLEDEEASSAAWSRAFEAEPAHPEASQEWLERLGKTEDWEALRNALETAATASEGSARGDHLHALGELALLRFEDAEAAAAAFEQALEIDPGSQRALEGLAQIAASSGDEDAIRRAYGCEAEVTTDRQRLATLVWELVRIHEARDEWNDALEWLNRLRAAAPEDTACIEAIVRQFEHLETEAPGERSDEHIAALETLEHVATGDARARARLQLAQLHDAAGNSADATRWLEASLDTNPRQVEATRQLLEQYTRDGRHVDRAQVQRRLADLLPPDEKLECMAGLAELLEEQLGDLDGAVVVLWNLTSEANCPAEIRERLTTLLERAGRYEELAQQLLEQRRALTPPDPGDAEAEAAFAEIAQDLELRRAELLLDPLGRFEEAATAFRALSESDTDTGAALDGLECALRADHDTAGLAELLTQRATAAETTGDVGAARRLQFERAVLLDDADGGGTDDTRAAYIELAEQDDAPSVATDAGARLESLFERTGDWTSLRERLEGTIALAVERSGAPEEQLALRDRLAGICRDRISDTDAAIEHLEAAGRLAPQRASTWQGLALLFDADERHADLRRAIEAELGCEVETDRKAVLHARAAQLAAHADEPDNEGAREHYEALLDIDAGHVEASEFLIEHYGAADQHDRLADLLRARIERTELPDLNLEGDFARSQRTSLRLRLAALQGDSLDDVDAAIATLREAYAEEGAVSVVASPLADLLQLASRSDDLIELCEATCAGELAPVELASWQLRRADALRGAHRVDEAVGVYESIADSSPESEDAKAALRQLYRELDRTEPLAALLVERLYAAPDSEATNGEAPRVELDILPIHLELAELYAGPLDRPTDALPHYESVLALEPSHRTARFEAVRIASDADLHEPLAELLEGGLEHAQAGEERAELLVIRGQLLAGPLERDDDAIASFREALAVEPNHLDARRCLREVYERAGRWGAALDCLFVEARLADDTDRRELLERGVSLAADHISIDATLPWLERLRSEAPLDEHTYGRIADVHRQAGRPEALLRTLEQQIRVCSGAQERRRLHCDRARVLERDLHSPSRALAGYEAAHAVDQNDTDVLRELARLRGSLGRVRAQVDALEALAALSEDTEQLELLREVAALCTDELSDRPRARRHLAAALALDCCDEDQRRPMLAALGEAALADGLLSQWVEVSERELALQDAHSQRALELREQLAHTYEYDLSALDRAATHALALSAWATDVGDACPATRRDAIEQNVIRLVSRLRDPIALETRLGSWLERHPEDASRALELARLRDETLHSTRTAADAYRLAAAADPTSLQAVRGMRDCAERLGTWSEVADALDTEVELRDDASAADRTALLRRLGDVTWHRLDDAPRAARAYERALSIEAGDLAALRSLEQLREACSEHEAALDLYERECETLGDQEPERRAAAWLRAGELARDYVNDAARALAAYDAAAEISELSAERELEWADLLLACGAAERHAGVYGHWCDRDDSPALAADHLRLADHLTDLGESQSALERTRRATEAEAGSRDAWDALARRSAAADLGADAANALEQAAKVSSGSAASTRYVAAALAIEDDDTQQALGWIRKAVESDSAIAVAHAHRARLAEQCGENEEAETAAGLALQGDSDPRSESETGAATNSEPAAVTTSSLSPELRLQASLVGGRAAKAREAWEVAAQFYGAALELEPDHSEGLGSAGEVLYALGDAPAARELLERQIGASDDASCLHLTIIAEGLELAGHDAEAAERFASAATADASATAAHAGAVRCLERLGRTEDAIVALESWAEGAEHSEERSRALLRAGELELTAGRKDDAEAHMRLALEEDDTHGAAWIALGEHLASEARADEALEVTEQANAQLSKHGDAAQRARVARVRGELLEARGETEAAAQAWGEVAKAAPLDTAAALAQARLLRKKGQWREAASALAAFTEAHPDPDELALARVYEEHARLLAGPLEEVEDAVAAYERALKLDPERSEARVKLASLLAMLPGRRRDAVAEHRELLRRTPTAPHSLRSLLRIAEAEGAEACHKSGLTILRALGIATPEERQIASSSLRTPIARDTGLDAVHHERIRCAIRESAEAFEALPQKLASGAEAGPSAEGFSVAINEVQRDLACSGLPELAALGDGSLHQALVGLAALAIDPTSPHTETEPALALDRSVGRRALRRARKQLEGTSLDDVIALDAELWLDELRALAAAAAVDRQGGELRAALVALIEESRPEVQSAEDTDLCALIEGCRPAQFLLARVVTAWCERIAREF